MFRSPLTTTPSADVIERAKACIYRHIVSEPLQQPNVRVYSDLGFILLGAVVEAVVDQPLEEWAKQELWYPLGLNETQYRPLKAGTIDQTIPPTGLTRPRHPAPGQEHDYSVRQQTEQAFPGRVDDDTAYAMGGVAGHAGVLSSARDVAAFGARIFEEAQGAGRLGRPEVLAEMIQVDAPQIQPVRGLGFDYAHGPGSSAGRHLAMSESPSTFGHLGFTGCSLWIDPKRALSVALLTNRVFPSRQNVQQIKAFRPLFHDTLIDFLENRL